jgi:hypothetical protein
MSSDIVIYDTSQYNIINNNICLGEKSDNGIMIIDPYSVDPITHLPNSYPIGNKFLIILLMSIIPMVLYAMLPIPSIQKHRLQAIKLKIYLDMV